MTDATSLRESDAICTSLQLINFWQDVAVDWEKGRVYIPAEDMDRFRVTEDDIAKRRADERWAKLMAFECERSRELLTSGAPLGRRSPAASASKSAPRSRGARAFSIESTPRKATSSAAARSSAPGTGSS
jgi:phytoene/squalene synthetase